MFWLWDCSIRFVISKKSSINANPQVFFSSPFLVVIRTTPFAALYPYKAEAVGPLRIETDSMSSGLISAAPFPKFASCTPDCTSVVRFTTVCLLIGMPSTTNRGELLLKEESPRIVILDKDPTPVGPLMICTPATLPERLLRKLGSLQRYHELHLRITQGTCRSSIQMDIADIHTFHTIYERPPDHHFSGQSGDNHHFYFGLTPNEEFLTRSKTEKIIICI